MLENAKYKRIAAIIALVLAASTLIAISVAGLSGKPAYRDMTADDYQVEHVTDLISSKITPPSVTP